MVAKLEVTIEIIVHATEDIKKIFKSIFELFNISEEIFSKQNLRGHFDNPIILMRAKLKKKEAEDFLKKLITNMPKVEFEWLISDIENRLQDSTLHLRFGKQEMIQGKIAIQEKDVVKLKIFTPSYNKKEMLKNYVNLLSRIS